MAGLIAAVDAFKAAGAKTVLVPDLPNIASTPQVKALEPAHPGISALATSLIQQFNTELAAALDAETGINIIRFDTFDLLKDERGTERLRGYFERYAQIACSHGLGLILEAPTWRASRDWGAKLGYDAVVRQIKEVDPPKPSTRLSTLGHDSEEIARHRGTDARQLRSSLRGDLDWIVMKALAKDRTRRYNTANAFAMDLKRHLRRLPVEAGPPSVLYRLRKFASRNRAAPCASFPTGRNLGIPSTLRRTR